MKSDENMKILQSNLISQTETKLQTITRQNPNHHFSMLALILTRTLPCYLHPFPILCIYILSLYFLTPKKARLIFHPVSPIDMLGLLCLFL
jgi:hypothetical protein